MEFKKLKAWQDERYKNSFTKGKYFFKGWHYKKHLQDKGYCFNTISIDVYKNEDDNKVSCYLAVSIMHDMERYLICENTSLEEANALLVNADEEVLQFVEKEYKQTSAYIKSMDQRHTQTKEII